MDWKQLITELQDAGLTQPQIAARCQCGQTTISDLLNGKSIEPRHALGEALKALHKAMTPARRRTRRESASAT